MSYNQHLLANTQITTSKSQTAAVAADKKQQGAKSPRDFVSNLPPKKKAMHIT